MFSDVDSLLFLGKHEERLALPIAFIKKALQLEKTLLQRFTALLNKRREQCFSGACSIAQVSWWRRGLCGPR
ncbi:hypothetical protein PINS_up022703 [Pythium insidiosum]|nr:hypothetical protein PINS_up022703 [Pythium insidiosum]